jgi:hypothetical protein
MEQMELAGDGAGEKVKYMLIRVLIARRDGVSTTRQERLGVVRLRARCVDAGVCRDLRQAVYLTADAGRTKRLHTALFTCL